MDDIKQEKNNKQFTNKANLQTKKKTIDIFATIIGSEKTGKSKLLSYSKGKYTNTGYCPPLIQKEMCCISKVIDQVTYEISILHNVCNPRNNSLLNNIIKQSKFIILFYDITNKDSFEYIKEINKVIKNEYSSDICVCVIGNKLDLVLENEELRKVSSQEALYFSSQFDNGVFYEISSKNEDNIEELIEMIIKECGNKGIN